eukprot:2498641-Pleurochrysis_carterae.AAC.2
MSRVRPSTELQPVYGKSRQAHCILAKWKCVLTAFRCEQRTIWTKLAQSTSRDEYGNTHFLQNNVAPTVKSTCRTRRQVCVQQPASWKAVDQRFQSKFSRKQASMIDETPFSLEYEVVPSRRARSCAH